MSTRLHFASKYDVQYSPVCQFTALEQEAIRSVLNEYECTVYSSGEYADEFDVEKADVAFLVKSLENETAGKIYNVQVEDLVNFFKAALDLADPNNNEIHFAWY